MLYEPGEARPDRLVAAVGDPNDVSTWSGIPYHFLQAARAEGLVDRGLPLAVSGTGWRARRWAWNAARLAGGDRYGGYQYSVPFLEQLWQPHRGHIQGSEVINCFQLYPPSVVADPSVVRWYFIDQTLRQLFDYYGQRDVIGRRILLEALARERLGYETAAGIVAHSQWAADSVRHEYGIPADRVHVVVPGPSLDAALYARWEQQSQAEPPTGENLTDPTRAVRLVFVGKYWRRKGLDRLLRAVTLARRRGCNVTLTVIGCERASLPSELRDTDGVEWLGFIDKRQDGWRFLQTVGSCHIGCLLSREEAGGIALREYHALGLVTLTTNTGGAPEHAIASASVVVDAQADDTHVAETLIALLKDRSRLQSLRAAAWAQRHSASWAASVRRLSAVWDRQAVAERR